jgi:type II secretory pathway component PulJ
MRHLDRNPALDERLEQRRRVLDRDTQAAGERGGRDDGCRRHDVDRNGRARTALTVLDRGERGLSLSFHQPQDLGAGVRLLG